MEYYGRKGILADRTPLERQEQKTYSGRHQ